MRSRAMLGTGAVALALLAMIGWRVWPAGNGAPLADAGTNPSASASDSASNFDRSSDLPASLRGTAPDGSVRFDGHGRLIADAELRRHFDWYLAALGEQTPEAIRTRLARDLALRMNPAQTAEALAWFDRYVAYQRASAQLAETSDLQRRLDAVSALRKRMLGESAAQGFFGEEETEALRVLALKRAQADPALGSSERESLRRDLETLSPGYAEAQRESTLRQQLHQLDAAMNRKNASASERHAERSALLGAEAADRFAELDRSRADWNARLQRYAQRNAALLTRRDLSETQRSIESRRLLSAFTLAEQRRIAGLREAGLLQ